MGGPWKDHRKHTSWITSPSCSYYEFKDNCHRIVTAIDSAIDFEQFQDVPTLAEQLQGVDDIEQEQVEKVVEEDPRSNQLTRRQLQSMRREELRKEIKRKQNLRKAKRQAKREAILQASADAAIPQASTSFSSLACGVQWADVGVEDCPDEDCPDEVDPTVAYVQLDTSEFEND